MQRGANIQAVTTGAVDVELGTKSHDARDTVTSNSDGEYSCNLESKWRRNVLTALRCKEAVSLTPSLFAWLCKAPEEVSDSGPQYKDFKEHLLSVCNISALFSTNVNEEDVNRSKGLSDIVALERLSKDGYNSNYLTTDPGPFWVFLLLQLADSFSLIPAVVGGGLVLLYYLYPDIPTEWVYTGIVFTVATVTSAIDTATRDYKTASLCSMSSSFSPNNVQVIRGGAKRALKTSMLVPGDLLCLSAGDTLAADCRAVWCSPSGVIMDRRGILDEMECVSVTARAQTDKVSFMNSRNILLHSTRIVKGKCVAIVLRTGPNTAFSILNRQLATLKPRSSSIKKEVKEYVYRNWEWALVVTLGLLLVGVVRGMPLLTTTITCIFVGGFSVTPLSLPSFVSTALLSAVDHLRSTSIGVHTQDTHAVLSSGTCTALCLDTAALVDDKFQVSRIWVGIPTPISNRTKGRASEKHASVTPSFLAYQHLLHKILLEAAYFGIEETSEVYAEECTEKHRALNSGLYRHCIHMLRNDYEETVTHGDVDMMSLYPNSKCEEDTDDGTAMPISEASSLSSSRPSQSSTETGSLNYRRVGDVVYSPSVCVSVADISRQSSNCTETYLQLGALSSTLASPAVSHTVYLLTVRGDPESVLQRSSHYLHDSGGKDSEISAAVINREFKDMVRKQCESFRNQGHDVVAIAIKVFTRPVPTVVGDAYCRDLQTTCLVSCSPVSNLCFVGMFSLSRDVVQGAVEAITNCHTGGVKLVLFSDNNPTITEAIARSVGVYTDPPIEETAPSSFMGLPAVVPGPALDSMPDAMWDELLRRRDIVFSGLSAIQKESVVSRLSKNDHSVAVVGAGVNDLLAMKQATVAAVVGRCASPVVRNFAGILLTLNSASGMVSCIEEGRLIRRNLRKNIVYSASHVVPQLLACALWVSLGAPLPLGMVLSVCLIAIVEFFPSTSLAFERTETTMKLSSHCDHLTALVSWRAVFYAVGQVGTITSGICVLLYFHVFNSHGVSVLEVLYNDNEFFPSEKSVDVDGGDVLTSSEQWDVLYEAQCAWFLGIVLCQAAHVFSIRTTLLSIIDNGILVNIAVSVGAVSAVAIALVIVFVPILQAYGGTRPLPTPLVLLAAGAAMAFVWTFTEARKCVLRYYPTSRVGSILTW